jgi:hypothetical protein
MTMDQQNKLYSLDKMTQESLASRPKDSIKAISEYLRNIHENIEGEIDFSKFSKEKIQSILTDFVSNKLFEENFEDLKDFGIDFETLEETFWNYEEEQKEVILSVILDEKIQQIVNAKTVEDTEKLVANLFVTLNKKALQLIKKISNNKYKEQYKIAITQTSLMVFISAYKSTQPTATVEFDKFIREYLFFSQSDDKDIYEMRLFYLGNISAKEIGIGEGAIDNEETSPAEAELIGKEVIRARTEYDSLIDKVKKKYLQSKLHLS